MEEDNNLMDSVVGNALIGEKIVSHLSFEDMRAASLAFRGLHGMVRSSQRFCKMSVLRLINTGKDGYWIVNKQKWLRLTLSSCSWGMVEFETGMPREILTFLENNSEILGNITTLRLTRKYRSAHEEAEDARKEREALLGMIFDNCTKIGELQIDLRLLRRQDFRRLIKPEFAKGIKSLEIFSHYRHNSEEDSLALQNLQHFCTTAEMKLENIKISLLDGYEDLSTPIINVIAANRETLKSLNFEADEACDLETIQDITFPNLKQVFLETFQCPVGNEWTKFLKNQPPLENLTVHFGEDCPEAFFEYLKNKTEFLKKLDLSACYYQRRIHWKFLANCSKLKEFTFFGREESPQFQLFIPIHGGRRAANGTFFLKRLPPCVTSLRLKGLDHFWEWRNGLVIPDLEIVSLLSRFPDMTHLDLVGCDNAVTNLAVQTIISQMPKLRELKFSHGSCTDFTITGIENGEIVGASLTELTGLTCLSIKNCPGISTDALLRSVRNPCLQSLEYHQCNDMTPEQVEQLVSQNPSLTDLSLRVDRSARELKAKLKTIRNWKNLQLYGASYCSHE